MKQYMISDDDLNNLLTFLNRVDYKGFSEVQAINKIIECLKNPIVAEGEGIHPPA